jgi:cytochrome c oxidase cbb3-type subunit 3
MSAPDPPKSPKAAPSRRGPGRAIALVLILAAGLLVWGGVSLHDHQMQARLLTSDPKAILADPELVDFAASLARPAYAKNCAGCHGARMQGDTSRGAPNLADKVWLFEDGGVYSIERTLLYGIRSGNGKSRNITDMPAIGRTQQLSAQEVQDVEAYVFSLSRPQADAAAVTRGDSLFQNKGSCYDCHSADGRGNPDYGAPDLTDNDWLYGGDPDAVYRSIYSGRHGLCPAWTGKLTPAVIRALAVYIHQASFGSTSAKGQAHG